MSSCPLPPSEAEELADALDREHHAHEQTRQALVEATRELERLRSVELAARGVLGVCDTTTGVDQTEQRLQQLGAAIATLRATLGDGLPPPGLRETVANLIMLAAMRAGTQGRAFDAYEAGTLVEAWLLGKPGLPQPTFGLGEDSRRREWLNQWTDGRVAEREAHLRSATEPFFEVACARLARLCHEPIPDGAWRALLTAFGLAVPATPAAFTAAHSLEPEMSGLPGGEDGGHD